MGSSNQCIKWTELGIPYQTKHNMHFDLSAFPLRNVFLAMPLGLRKTMFLINLIGIQSFALAQYTVNFEGAAETKAAYTAGNVTLNGISWRLTNVLIGTDNNDLKLNNRSARFQVAATMQMQANKSNGLGTITFQAGRSNFTNDRSNTAPRFVVEYSTNNGSSWTQAGAEINLDGINSLTQYSRTVNVSGNVRVRFRTTAGNSGRRFNIDNIVITDYIPALPELNITGAPDVLCSWLGEASSATTVTFSANNLTANLQIAAPTGFDVSTSFLGTSESSSIVFNHDTEFIL